MSHPREEREKEEKSRSTGLHVGYLVPVLFYTVRFKVKVFVRVVLVGLFLEVLPL